MQCSEGGTSIEDLAEKYPDKIIKIPVDIRTGITDAQALQMAKGLAVSGDLKAAAEQIKALYKLFDSADCTRVEVCVCVCWGGGGLGWCRSVAGGIPVSPCPGTWRMRARVYTLFDAADCIMVDVRGSLGGGGMPRGSAP